MPRTCTICNHESRKQIDAALAGGESYRNIAERYGTSIAALNRHKSHIAEAVAIAVEKREVNMGESVLARLDSLYYRCEKILADAEATGNGRLALQGIRELRETLGGLYTLVKDTEPPKPERIDYTTLLQHAAEFYGLRNFSARRDQ